MSGSAAYTFAVVCEAPADLRLVADLADRVFCHEVEWIDPESLDLHRLWRGLELKDNHLEWHWVRRVAKEHHLGGPHGHFKEKPGTLDAAMARKALLLLADVRNPPDAVVLVRDTDGWEERRRGLTQARDVKPWPFEIVLAVAHTKRECWVLAGFDPCSESEEKALAELRQELGFDPRVRAEELTAAAPNAPRNAKRVLDRLLSGNQDREQECWAACDLETLAERGRLTGLADYLEEVRERLVPLFTNRDSQASG
jgi:hypothetical protein